MSWRFLVAAVAFAAAGLLAYNHIDGWGWFLAAGVIIVL